MVRNDNARPPTNWAIRASVSFMRAANPATSRPSAFISLRIVSAKSLTVATNSGEPSTSTRGGFRSRTGFLSTAGFAAAGFVAFFATGFFVAFFAAGAAFFFAMFSLLARGCRF